MRSLRDLWDYFRRRSGNPYSSFCRGKRSQIDQAITTFFYDKNAQSNRLDEGVQGPFSCIFTYWVFWVEIARFEGVYLLLYSIACREVPSLVGSDENDRETRIRVPRFGPVSEAV